jgi:hypothetical protein
LFSIYKINVLINNLGVINLSFNQILDCFLIFLSCLLIETISSIIYYIIILFFNLYYIFKVLNKNFLNLTNFNIIDLEKNNNKIIKQNILFSEKRQELLDLISDLTIKDNPYIEKRENKRRLSISDSSDSDSNK